MRGTYRATFAILPRFIQFKGFSMNSDLGTFVSLLSILYFTGAIVIGLLPFFLMWVDDLPDFLVGAIIILVDLVMVWDGWYPEIWEPAPLPFSPNAVFSFCFYCLAHALIWREYRLRQMRRWLSKFQDELFDLKYGKPRPH